MAKWDTRVVWEMSADVTVEAESSEEAKELAMEKVYEVVNEVHGSTIPKLPTSRLRPDAMTVEYISERNEKLTELRKKWKRGA